MCIQNIIMHNARAFLADWKYVIISLLLSVSEILMWQNFNVIIYTCAWINIMNMFRDWDQLVFIYILNVRKYLVTEYLKLGELGCKLGSNSSRCSRQINHFRLNFIFVLACMIQYTRTRVVPTYIQNRILNILGKEYLVMNSKTIFSHTI